MRADRVEASWDLAKSKWLIRIQSGEEVIRRHCDAAKMPTTLPSEQPRKQPRATKATKSIPPTS